MNSVPSEFQPCLKRYHPRGTIAAEPDPEQSSRRGGRIGQRPEPRLCRRLAGDARIAEDREPEVWVIKKVEDLAVYSQFHTLT